MSLGLQNILPLASGLYVCIFVDTVAIIYKEVYIWYKAFCRISVHAYYCRDDLSVKNLNWLHRNVAMTNTSYCRFAVKGIDNKNWTVNWEREEIKSAPEFCFIGEDPKTKFDR